MEERKHKVHKMGIAKESKKIQKARRKVKQDLHHQSKKVGSRVLKRIAYLLRTQCRLSKEEIQLSQGHLSFPLDNEKSAAAPTPGISKLKEKISSELKLQEKPSKKRDRSPSPRVPVKKDSAHQ